MGLQRAVRRRVQAILAVGASAIVNLLTAAGSAGASARVQGRQARLSLREGRGVVALRGYGKWAAGVLTWVR